MLWLLLSVKCKAIDTRDELPLLPPPSRCKAQLQSSNESHDGETSQAETSDLVATADDDLGRCRCGGEETSASSDTAADGSSSGEASLCDSAGLGRAGGNRSVAGDRNDANTAAGGSGEANLGHSEGGADNNGGAGAGDGLASRVGARNNSGLLDSDGRVDGAGHRGGSDSDVSSHSLSTSGNGRVARDVRSADTLEEDDGLRDDGVGLTI